MQKRILNFTYWSLLGLIVFYVLLRAYFVSPLFDECANYSGNIIFGKIWSGDANNHLLNSLVGHLMYLIGLDHFFFFRLLSVAGFVAYIFAWHKLVFHYLDVKWKHFIVLCAVSVPWILEYGAFARGYLVSMAALMWMIVLLIEFFKTGNTRKLITFYLLAWIGIFSCLAFTVPIFLLIGVLFIYNVVNLRNNTRRQLWLYVAATFIFVLAYLPLYEHSMMLKESNSLWWGSRAGLWEVSGLSISKLVLFSEAPSIQYFLYGLLFLSFIFLCFQLYKTKPSAWFGNPFNWIPAYVFGLLLCLIFFSLVLKINYPMDRVGMYLVPLFIFLVIHVFSAIKPLRFGLLLLLFFPFSLLQNLNLYTSIFSPQDRITKEVYEKIESLLPEKAQLGTEWMGFVIFNQKMREYGRQRVIYRTMDDYPLNTEYLLLVYRPKGVAPEGYKEIVFDPDTGVALYKKIEKKPVITEVFKISDVKIPVPLYEFVVVPEPEKWTSKPFSYRLEADFVMDKPIKNFVFLSLYVDSAGVEHILQHNAFQADIHPKTTFHCVLTSNTFPALNAQRLIFDLETSEDVKVEMKNAKLFMTREK